MRPWTMYSDFRSVDSSLPSTFRSEISWISSGEAFLIPDHPLSSSHAFCSASVRGARTFSGCSRFSVFSVLTRESEPESDTRGLLEVLLDVLLGSLLEVLLPPRLP